MTGSDRDGVTATGRPDLPRIVVLGRDRHDRPPGIDVLEGRAEIEVVDADRLPAAIPGADGLFVWDFFSPAVRAAWPQADRLRWIHVAATGVDAVLFDELVDSDVTLTHARGMFDQPIAEYVLAMILAHSKLLFQTRELQQQHRWEHRETRSLQGQRAMIVGTGGIGRAIARLLTAAGMTVRGAGRVAAQGDPDFGEVIASSELAGHVGDVDHLVMIAPLTSATKGLIDRHVLSALPARSHLINVGRGPSVDEDAVLQALRSGQLGAASLDVFGSEPLPEDHPFWDEPTMFVSPHMSGDTEGWLERLAGQFVDLAERWLDGRELINVVDKARGYGSSATAPDPATTREGRTP